MSKNSFILHNDSLDVLDELTDEQAGMLFKAMRAYHLGEYLELDSLTKIVFSPFKNQFIRDDLKYQKTCERRAVAGSMGGKQKAANASKCKKKLANLADNDNVSKSDNDNDSDSKKIKDLPAIADEYVFQLPTNKTDIFYLVTIEEINNYKETYQAVDIEQQYKSIISWLTTNPKNRKTKSGMPRFINSWLSRAQNSAPRAVVGGNQYSQTTMQNIETFRNVELD